MKAWSFLPTNYDILTWNCLIINPASQIVNEIPLSIKYKHLPF